MEGGIEKELYDQYVNQLLNPEKAEQKGYFWLVKEIRLFEVSAVMFGANSLTPTLSVSVPSEDTQVNGNSAPLDNTQQNGQTNTLFFSHLLNNK